MTVKPFVEWKPVATHLIAVLLTGFVFWMTFGREQELANQRQDHSIVALTTAVAELKGMVMTTTSDVVHLTTRMDVLVTKIEMTLPLVHPPVTMPAYPPAK